MRIEWLRNSSGVFKSKDGRFRIVPSKECAWKYFLCDAESKSGKHVGGRLTECKNLAEEISGSVNE